MEEINHTIGLTVRMGEMRVDRDGGTLRTLLGSCVGLALYDRRRKIGGLAHIVLPDSRGKTDRPGKFVDLAIPALIEQMEKLAGEKLRLTARIAGGASMFATSTAGNIGQQNAESCRQTLSNLRIPVLASDCGGEKGRRMSFDTENGNVVIEIVGQEPIELK
jgi:chemotaxis protein CheD